MHEGGPGGVWFSLELDYFLYRFLDWMFFLFNFFQALKKKTSHGQIFSYFFFLG